jgi:hypothetical protein
MAIAPAATGSVSVIITAIDGATKTIEAVQKRIAGMVSPITDVTRSLGRMGEAIGLGRLKERLVGIGEGFRSMTEGVTRSFERLGLVLLGGGGLLEGFRRIAEGVAEIGVQAKKIGLTAEHLRTQLTHSSRNSASGCGADCAMVPPLTAWQAASRNRATSGVKS